MRYKQQIKRLESKVNAGDKPQMIFSQTWEDANLFTCNGQTYTHAQVDELGVSHNVIKVCYVEDWREI